MLPIRTPSIDKVIELDLGAVEPLMAKPHSPDNIGSVKELAGTRVDQVMVGSCTNSSYRDLMIVASLLKGRRVFPDVSFGVAPGSRQVLEMIAKNGALADIISAGARVLESTCGFCIGAGQAPENGCGLDPDEQPQFRRPVRHEEREGLSRQPGIRSCCRSHRRHHGPPRSGHPLSRDQRCPSSSGSTTP